jgi:FKBP-type peptidyl-prolyl cis-trans isomerase SlyD
MEITKHKVALIEYELTDDSGEVLDTSKGRGPLGYVHGVGSLIPGLESELEGKTGGDAFKIRVEPENAYGERIDEMVQAVPRTEMPADVDITVGMQFQAQTPSGAHVVTVIELSDETVTLDANHPLAGVHLNFDVTVVEVREATEEEVEHGHPHGPGGHDH